MSCKLLVLTLCFVAVSFAAPGGISTLPAIKDEIISAVNTIESAWTAGRNEYFEGKSMADVSMLMGTIMTRSGDIPSPNEMLMAVDDSDIPQNFDAREQWPSCIHDIRDQAQCGSCWAFAASEALSDRFCIASKGKVNVVLSPQDLVSCDHSCKYWFVACDSGCSGGIPDNAWKYMTKTGISTDSCMPYTSKDGSSNGQCSATCADGADMKKYHAKNVVDLTSVEQIQRDIMTNGPVEAGFHVYEDFMHYTSGVYSHVTGSMMGGHAIKILGWGVENGVDYWLCANSWTTTWGDKGYFKIKRGTDECAIEDMAGI